jgi:3-dehydroquinate synthase
VPFAIINDFAFLESLPDRERRNGIIEAIKVALIRDRDVF